MRRRLQISVIGSSAPDPELDRTAEEVGRLIAEAGAVVVCGGRDGVMEAVSRGAAQAGGEVLAILPDADPALASSHASHVVATGAGYTRNLAVVASGSAVIAVGGKWGTLSEIAFARDLGRSVFALDTWEVRGRGDLAEHHGVDAVATPAEAVDRAIAAAAD